MGKEIERKYLVKGDYKNMAYKSIPIKQGYISVDNKRTVRVRITDKTAYLTIKGEQKGISRFEWEIEIALNDAEELFGLCSENIIEKTRYLVKQGDYIIEVDEFSGRNTGLTLAEIELESEDDNPALPEWIGDEVSEDYRYHNSNLSIYPYTEWGNI